MKDHQVSQPLRIQKMPNPSPSDYMYLYIFIHQSVKTSEKWAYIKKELSLKRLSTAQVADPCSHTMRQHQEIEIFFSRVTNSS
jgi:hypothetical protein